jgi:hypothetical protein
VNDPRFELWAKRLLIVIVSLVCLIGLGLLGAAFLPRWWAHRIGGQVHGSIAVGVALGLFYGFVFTALPIAVLRYTFAKRRALKVWASTVLFAIILALPNLLTLGIVLGRGNAAHAGQRTLDVEAPAYRGAALAGVLSAFAAFGLLTYLVSARGRSRRELARLRAEKRAAKS